MFFLSIGTFLELQRSWKNGDRVSIEMDLPLRILTGGDGQPLGKQYPDNVALQRGPQVLATDDSVNEATLPTGWIGSQVYLVKVMQGDTEKQLILVPYADAGQSGSAFNSIFDAFKGIVACAAETMRGTKQSREDAMKQPDQVLHSRNRGFIGRAVLVIGSAFWTMFSCQVPSGEVPPVGFRVDADFPGGNIQVERIEGNTLLLSQDKRRSDSGWPYWCFRVVGAGGRELHVAKGKLPFAALGPAVSLDEGKTWDWLGASAVGPDGFRYKVPDGAQEARFCIAMSYTEANLQRFFDRYRGNPHLKREALCKTTAGREAEVLYAGRLDGRAPIAVAITCRHHACEMMSNWALEGIVESILADNDDGRWWRENVELLAVPFVDKDGVEAGDPGKLRKPHDHGVDYAEATYPTVRAFKELLPRWSAGRLRLGIDIHCPSLGDQKLMFVEGPNEANNEQVRRFSQILEAVQKGPLVFNSKNNYPYGRGWNNTPRDKVHSFPRWARTLLDRPVTTVLEIPYARADGKPVTATSAGRLGGDLAAAMRAFLLGKPVEPPAGSEQRTK